MTALEAFWNIRSEAGSKGATNYGERVLSGTVALTPEVRIAFQILAEAGELPELQLRGTHCAARDLPEFGEVRFQARAPTSYFETLAELIGRYPHSPPPDFCIFVLSDDDKKLLYLETSQLAKLLISLAATTDLKRCIIFAKDKLEIPFLYSPDDLRPIPDLTSICALMAPPTDGVSEPLRLLETYQILFKQALYDVLSNVSREKRFTHLIEHFKECVFRFRLSFTRFSEEANTLIERYEDKRAGMITALNAVLGNIQTSLIGIPLAGLLALKEMKPEEGCSFVNVVIVVASVTVAVLLFILTLSQGKTLDAIACQHKQLKKEIDDSGGGATKISSALESMAAHQVFISRLLIAVRVIIIIFALVAVGALFWHML